jgi:hypothetical protein
MNVGICLFINFINSLIIKLREKFDPLLERVRFYAKMGEGIEIVLLKSKAIKALWLNSHIMIKLRFVINNYDPMTNLEN